jgi:hypothetical protein
LREGSVMRARSLLYLCVMALLCSGCTESAAVKATPSQNVGTLIENPTKESLKAHLGTLVTIEGTYSLDKAGDVIVTPRVSLLFDQGYGAISTPEFDRPIKVTGTLTELTYPPEYPYELKNAVIVELSPGGAPR